MAAASSAAAMATVCAAVVVSVPAAASPMAAAAVLAAVVRRLLRFGRFHFFKKLVIFLTVSFSISNSMATKLPKRKQCAATGADVHLVI